MTTIPLIRTDDNTSLTPLERNKLSLDQVVTALMMQATLNDPQVTDQEREAFTTVSVATIIPAEA